jgi:hypothetical protein
MRAIELLECVGSPAARKVMERLAAGSPDARVTREASASLARLKRREGRE